MIAQPEAASDTHHDREQFCSCSGIMLARELLAEDIGEVAERVVQVFGGLLFSADGDSSLLALFPISAILLASASAENASSRVSNPVFARRLQG